MGGNYYLVERPTFTLVVVVVYSIATVETV